MACNAERLAEMPIKHEYKQQLARFCSDPNNAQVCQQLCNSSDQEIAQGIQAVEKQLGEWSKNGMPPELKQGMAQQNPEVAAGMDQLLAAPETQARFQGTEQQAQSGIGSLVPPGTPPSQVADIPMPMDTPQNFGLGGFVSRLGKNISGSLGGNSGIFGAIVGGALAFATGGMSLAWGAALGAAAGNFTETKDLKSAIGAGLTGFTLGTGVQMAGVGAGTTTAVTAPKPTGGISNIGNNAGTANAMGSNVGTDAIWGPGRMENGFISAPAPMANTPMAPVNTLNITPPGGSTPYTGMSTSKQAFVAPSTANVVAPVAPTSTAPAVPTPATAAAAEPSFIDKYGKYGLGLTMLAGMGEEIPQAEGSSHDPLGDYYTCLASGRKDCVPPSDLTPSPRANHTFGQTTPVTQQGIGTLAQRPPANGFIQGPGTGTSDSIPANLSDGEFVMTAEAVRNAGGPQAMYNLQNRLTKGRRV